MSDKEKESSAVSKTLDVKPKSPYVFLSHDTRDAEIAEAFAKLLASVTAGVLKCFRSSDKRGSQGIEYGVEWFPELMKKLHEASDVVCLLTENSVNRPWILFEAGVAKGKLDTPILGLALGIPLGTANTGPFAQFQNSDDEEDALVKLVTQLVRKIPGAEPDDAIVRQQVNVFRVKVAELLKKKPSKPKEPSAEQEETASVAKLFEEIKVMFNDLPARLDTQVAPIRRRSSRKISPAFIEETIYMTRKANPFIGFLILLSLIREDMPWVYDTGRELIDTARRGDTAEVKAMLAQFHDLIEMSIHGPFVRETFSDRIDSRFIEEVIHHLHDLAEQIPRFIRKTKK